MKPSGPMTQGMRRTMQLTGLLLVMAFAVLAWLTRKTPPVADTAQGEEVYASHDCSDCHLGVNILRQKREKKEAGLIRVRKDLTELVSFLQADARHRSFVMISAEDRKNLIEYLRSLVIP